MERLLDVIIIFLKLSVFAVIFYFFDNFLNIKFNSYIEKNKRNYPNANGEERYLQTFNTVMISFLGLGMFFAKFNIKYILNSDIILFGIILAILLISFCIDIFLIKTAILYKFGEKKAILTCILINVFFILIYRYLPTLSILKENNIFFEFFDTIKIFNYLFILIFSSDLFKRLNKL